MYKLKKINKTMMYQIATDMGVDMGAKRAECEFTKMYRHNCGWLNSSNYKLYLDTCMGVVYLYVRSWDRCEDFVLKLDFDYLQSHGYLVEIPDDPESEVEADPEPEIKADPEPEQEIDQYASSPLNLELYDAYKDVSVLGGFITLPFPGAGWILDRDHYTLLGYLLNERGPDASPAAYLRVYEDSLNYVRNYTGPMIDLYRDAHLDDYNTQLLSMSHGCKHVEKRHMLFEIQLLRLWEWLHDSLAQRYPFEPDGRAVIL